MCKKGGSKQTRRNIIPNRVDISQRPQHIEKKEHIGDWEGDLIIGASGSGALITLVDRASKYVLIGFVATKNAYEVRCKIQDMMIGIKDKVNTITFDNGREFTDHIAIQKTLGAKTYFATPYHSWERGLSEHTNGLIRKFFPKKIPFKDVSKENILRVQNLLNNRPRKVLNFKTPNEVFLPNTS
ncbi:MAG: IS30 family transposase [Bacteroidota bacterium]